MIEALAVRLTILSRVVFHPTVGLCLLPELKRPADVEDVCGVYGLKDGAGSVYKIEAARSVEVLLPQAANLRR